jgi:ATP-dependent RNA helicase RhlE
MYNTTYKNTKQDKARPNRNKPSGSFGRHNGQRRQGQGQKKSTLDPSLLIQKATHTEVKNYVSERTIQELPIASDLKENLLKKNFERPSEIQDKTLEFLLEGNDLLGIAQTGTGKTAAFLIPIIQQLIHSRKNSYALIVVPTRELATQVQDEFRSMTNGMNLFSACFIGGGNVNKDVQLLRRPHQVIVGTPGRLLDLVNRKALDLNKFNTLVLDEFDRMLDMGFIHDVKRIIHGMHQRKHSMLFSATLDKTQQRLISEILSTPKTVKVSNGESTSTHIDQDIIRIGDGQDKFQVLFDLIDNPDFQKVLLFEETKHKVSRLCDKLNRAGIKSDQIHGNKSQNARQNALNSFKRGNIRVLVATDVAARGIDVSDVTHVINYQIPMTFDSYIHRIGRTGRAGKTGKAFTFVG